MNLVNNLASNILVADNWYTVHVTQKNNLLLHFLYEAAFDIYKFFVGNLAFPAMRSNIRTSYGSAWQIAQNAYEAILKVAIPIATIFFIIAIYRSVVTRPAEEQAKQFFHDALRYVLILVISANLWTILGYVFDITAGITDQVLLSAADEATASKIVSGDKAAARDLVSNIFDYKTEGGYYVQRKYHSKIAGGDEVTEYGDIDKVIQDSDDEGNENFKWEFANENHQNGVPGGTKEANKGVSTLFIFINEFNWHLQSSLATDGIPEFMDKLFEFIILLLGGLITIIIFTISGISVISVAMQRIFKPLIILPFSAIVIAVGACSGEGDRMMWHYAKSIIGFCLSGAFMIFTIMIGMDICQNMTSAIMDDYDGAQWMLALVCVASINIGVICLTGILKAIDSIIAKVFG